MIGGNTRASLMRVNANDDGIMMRINQLRTHGEPAATTIAREQKAKKKFCVTILVPASVALSAANLNLCLMFISLREKL